MVHRLTPHTITFHVPQHLWVDAATHHGVVIFADAMGVEPGDAAEGTVTQ